MRITRKGQVTIPKDIRERIGLLPGTEVEFEVSGSALLIRKASNTRGPARNLVERMRGRATTGMSTEEIMKLTRV